MPKRYHDDTFEREEREAAEAARERARDRASMYADHQAHRRLDWLSESEYDPSKPSEAEQCMDERSNW